MSLVIAGMYEIDQQIGAGGGGIVYLGRHLRLKKQGVLKADKRTLNTKEEALRREVDMLKKLSHTYIPQVYDFVQENGVVYTVMDFIEGEISCLNIGAGQAVRVLDVVAAAARILQVNIDLSLYEPPAVVTPPFWADIRAANERLCWVPRVSLEEGLERYIRFSDRESI